jgi:hypothetical protein
MKILMTSTGVQPLVVVSFCGRQYHALRFNQLDGHVVVFQTSARADNLKRGGYQEKLGMKKKMMILSSDEPIWPRLDGKDSRGVRKSFS